MTPEQAARGLALLDALGHRVLPDLKASKQGYPDLSQIRFYGGNHENSAPSG